MTCAERIRKLVRAFGISGLLLAQLSCRTGPLTSDPDTFLAPSMVELIARAPEFDGERIQTKGFYGGVITALFLTRDHAEILDQDSAVHVADPTAGTMREHCVDHYVRVEGTFNRVPGTEARGPSVRNFGITDVKEITILGGNGKETRCWPPSK